MPTSVYRSTRYIDKHSIFAIAVLLHCSQAAAERLALGGGVSKGLGDRQCGATSASGKSAPPSSV